MSSQTSLGKIAAPRPKLKALTQRAIKVADQASTYLAEEGFAELQSRIEGMSNKDFLNALNFMERIALSRQLVAKQAGVSKFSEGVQTAKTIVNVNIHGDLPLEERIKLIQAEVSGVPLILPGLPQAQISVNAPERPLAGVATSPVPEVTFPSEIPPAGLTGVQEPLDERIEDL